MYTSPIKFDSPPYAPKGHTPEGFSRRASILLWIQRTFLVCAGILHVLGTGIRNYNMMEFGNLCIYACIIVFCAADLCKRLILLLFSLILFVFLSCRPLIDCLTGTSWWEEYGQSDILFALRSVALSLLMLYLGAVLYVHAVRVHPEASTPRIPRLQAENCGSQNISDKRALQITALCLYAVSMGCFLYGELDKLIFMQGRDYSEYYLSYDAAYPFWIRTAGYCMPYALCAFLATLPKKKQVFPVLALYLLSAVPSLMFGRRKQIVLNALFIFLYYAIRDSLKDEKRWLGRWETGVILTTLPAACIGLSAMNYLRDGFSAGDPVVVNIVVDLFHKQGVSFRTLCIGHAALPHLPGAARNFTFGPFIDQVLYGRIGLLLFGTDPLPAGNCADLAARSHKLGDPLAFAAHPGYLEGHGFGSSYLLELFADYGFIGIAVYSFLLGILLIYCMDAMKKDWFIRTLMLSLLTNLFYIPRAAATDWLVFLIQIHFWFVVLVCLLGKKLLGRMRCRILPRHQRSRQ